MHILGLDIGGTGIKGAVVDVEKGELVTPRERLLTPNPSTPELVARTVNELVRQMKWEGPIGAGFPSVVRHGVVQTAANIDQSWIGTAVDDLFTRETGRPVFVTNDADAAGIAEVYFGAGMEFQSEGVVIMLTLGTGIGSAIFTNGVLLPNTEFGHLKMNGKDAERRTSDAARQRKDMSWGKWASRLEEYIYYLEDLFWPDLIIIGGGGSKHFDKVMPLMNPRTKIVPARFLNEAGMIGAAMYAAQKLSASTSAVNSPLG